MKKILRYLSPTPQTASTPNGFSTKWLQPQMASAPNGFSPKLPRSQMASASNGHSPDWLQPQRTTTKATGGQIIATGGRIIATDGHIIATPSEKSDTVWPWTRNDRRPRRGCLPKGARRAPQRKRAPSRRFLLSLNREARSPLSRECCGN